jgi:hypothetical protein
MAPKYHPTPLSGGYGKALNKELGKARTMTPGHAVGRDAGEGRDDAAAGRPATLRILCRIETPTGFRHISDEIEQQRQYERVGHASSPGVGLESSMVVAARVTRSTRPP